MFLRVFIAGKCYYYNGDIREVNNEDEIKALSEVYCDNILLYTITRLIKGE